MRHHRPDFKPHSVGSEGLVPGDELGDLQSVLRAEFAVLVAAALAVAEPADYGYGQ